MAPLMLPGCKRAAFNTGLFAKIVRGDTRQGAANDSDLFSIKGNAQRIHCGRFAGARISDISNPKRHLCRYHSRLLRSRCPHTQQPDWGDLFVALDAATVPTPESLLAYLISFRQENQFHEAVVETIYHRLYTYCAPAELMVLAQYTRRGGIDINPLRYTSEKILPFELGAFARTPRQ